MKKIERLLLLFLLLPVVLLGQSYFSKSFTFGEGSDGNTGSNIVPYEDGYLILGGRVNDFGIEYAGLAKVDLGGNPEWKKTYYFENQDAPPDPGLNMVVDETSIFVGCQYLNSVTKLDIQLLCIDKNTHDTLWTKAYPSEYNDFILQILETGDDGLVLITSVRTSPNISKLRLIKTDKSGNLIWEKYYSNFILNFPWQSCIAGDGNILLGYTALKSGGIQYFGALTKVNLNGEILWTQTFNNSDSGIKPNVAALENGDIAFGWTVDTFSANLFDFPPIVYILDSTGNIKNSHIFYHYSLRELFSLRVLPNGDILGIGTADGTFDIGGWLFRMSPSGELLWDRAIADKRYNIGNLLDATSTPDNGIIATGVVFTKDIPEQVHVWLLKLDGNGCYESDCGSVLLITPSIEAPLPDHTYRIYPNPAVDYFYVEGLTGVEETRLEISNITGQIVRTVISPQSGGINIADLPSGEYVVKITLRNNLFYTLQLLKP